MHGTEVEITDGLNYSAESTAVAKADVAKTSEQSGICSQRCWRDEKNF